MSEDNPIDSNLLKRMMMGEFSSQSSHDEHTKGNKRQKNNVLDLHFNKLYPSKSFLSPNEKLNLQLEAVDEFIKSSKKNSVRSVYIIVGKGEGVLKRKVSEYLDSLKIQYSLISDPPYFGNALKLRF
ncbi:MAG: Smr/MutS family protein [Bacteroidia bacterium]|nr:Smr/MutS family protein [Bacteroidia bacterium]